MTFAILLTFTLLFMAVYTVVFMRQRVVWLLLPCYLFALVLVWQPQTSTFIAHHMGIGRGLDLFLMLATVILINAIIIITRHVSLLHQQQTRLARNIALYRAHTEQPGGTPVKAADSAQATATEAGPAEAAPAPSIPRSTPSA